MRERERSAPLCRQVKRHLEFVDQLVKDKAELSSRCERLVEDLKLLERKLRHGNHPILEMCAKNATVIGDSGARKFDKRKATRRIDGMVALAMAVGVMPTEGVAPSVYEERGILII